MANEFKKQKQKQKYLLGVVGLIMLTVVAVLYFGFFREKSDTVEIAPVSLIKEINIDFNVLENPFLEKMRPFEKIPEYEGEIGRENPFLPY